MHISLPEVKFLKKFDQILIQILSMEYTFIINLLGDTNIDIVFLVLIKLKHIWLLEKQDVYLFWDGEITCNFRTKVLYGLIMYLLSSIVRILGWGIYAS